MARPAGPTPTERERLAEAIAERLDAPVSALGIIFALIVLAQTTTDVQGPLATTLEVLSWLIWGIFVVEFLARMVVAPSTGRFFRRNWWQLVFLAVPFLRFLRGLQALRFLRVGRAARVVGAAVRTGRTSRQALSGRLGWLGALTVIVVLAGSQLLYVLETFDTYGEALYRTALLAVTGESFPTSAPAARALVVALAVYAVVVFATLAGTVGAYLLEQRAEEATATHRTTPVGRDGQVDRVSPLRSS